jgi:hypothetical protein
MELELEHKSLIEEEKINVSELTDEIKSEIRGLDLMIGKFKKNQTEETKDKIERKSIEIADDIQDWLERDLEEADDDDDDEGKETSKAPIPSNDDVKKKTTASAEAQIIEILKQKGKIDSTILRDILEAGSINNVPDKLKIGNTILERSFSYYYKVD